MNKALALAGAGALLLLLVSSMGERDAAIYPPVPRRPAPRSPAGVAERELLRWQGLTEHDPAAAPILAQYWASVGQNVSDPDVPWSAAFISYTVKSSETPDALTPSGAHIYYARQAYLDRGVPGRYGAYRPEEVAVEPGDIVVRRRAGDSFSFSDLQQSGAGMIKTHGDIVTEVGPTTAQAIGGNMGGIGVSTVKERSIPHNGGVVTDPAVVAVLRYQRPGSIV